MSNYDAYDSPSRPDRNCRSCTDFKTWSKKQREITQTPKKKFEENNKGMNNHTIPDDCPLDKDTLGQSTWGLLHTIAAIYPKNPTTSQKQDVKVFYDSLSRLYPCEVCSKDFQKDIKEHPVNANSQAKLSQWLCNFHNRVNAKLGKPQFDCSKVDERWRDGWKDGSCD
ncbi:FAD-linked sulfhydryl oxidase ALR isoform X2 [Eupeodes corollae]|uniref:FAD-linked sulfhydryl oxidase ALR isoform X2 n=1 Tax=Eupeodes corollae TaxID=290404 RepID=UPI002491AA19|nr:FAD-linked sulfhydryl oxidase ALR isoform X2 [Eupeodes corollae]